MKKNELHKFLKFYGYFMLVVVLNLYVIPLHAQLPYSETFKNSIASNVLISGTPGDAYLTAGSIDLAGAGYLRLTNNQNNQSGYVQSTTSFPTADGLSISFEYFTYGGTGADGITFFLYDATAINSFQIGAFGGSLGYAQSDSSPGVSKGFLALGLDEFGNFSNPNAGRQGGPGRVASSVLLRGDGNGLGPGIAGSNYKYLKGISTNNTTDMAAAGAGGIFHVAGGVDGRTSPTGMTPLSNGYRKAKIDMIPNATGNGFILNVWITEGNATGAVVHQVIKDYSYIPIGPIPNNLSYGFSASTGGESNFHEIRNLEILKPLDPTTIPSISNVNVQGVENVDVTFKSSDFSSKFNQAQALPLTKIKIQNLPNYGVLKFNNALVTAGLEINVSDIAKLKFVPLSDFSGSSSFQWNGSDGTSYSSSDAFVNLKITGFNPTFPYLESFMKSSASGLIKSGSPNPAELTSGTIDPTDAGYLRLTKAAINQTGYAYSTKNFSSDKGLSISFDYYMHGGTGSDGISFFLYDAAATPFSIGAFGGSLGYTQNNTDGGVSKAFIGLAIDEFGNFSNTGSGRQSGVGKYPGSITLRGDGDGKLAIPSNYEYLKHTQTSNAADMSAIDPVGGNVFPLSGNTNGRSAGISGLDPLKTGYRRLKMELVPNGSNTGFKVNVWITEGNPLGEKVHQVIKDYPYIPTDGIPAKLRYGFSAGNGGFPTIYEIRNLEILLPSSPDNKPELKSIELSGNEDQDIVFQLSDFENSFFDPTATKTLKKVEFTTLPLTTEGILKLDGVDVIAEQKISVSDISSGKLKFIPTSDVNGKLSSFKWNGYTSTLKSEIEEDVLITLNPVNDPPLSEDVEILMGSKVNVLAAANFKLTDSKDNILNTLKAVKITSLPALGVLKLDNALITTGQFIAIEDISSGKLTFTPAPYGNGKPYTSFTFNVQDNGGVANGGIDLSHTANSFKINVAPIPAIELEQPHISVCIGSQTATFNYTLLSGEPLPNSYKIDWDDAANAAGLADINNKDLLPGAITVENISNLTVATYNGLLTVINKGYEVLSVAKPVSLTIKTLLRAEISYGAGAFCAQGKTEVTVSGYAGGSFTSSVGLIINELTGEVNLTQSTPGTYTVSYTLSNGTCSFTATAPLIIKAMPIISAITGSNNVIAGSTIQLTSATAGGTWSSNNIEVLTVNSAGLARGIKKGEAQIFYVVKNEGCIDSVSFQVNVSPTKASDMSKITNENKSIVFSNSDFYILIDAVTRANDPANSAISRIRIESLPSNGVLKINGVPVNLAQEILFADLSKLMYIPGKDFRGADIFKWNWADISGKYGELNANVNIAVIGNSSFKIVAVNDIKIDEKSKYISNTLEFYGEPSGKVTYSLLGKDSGLFTVNELNGVVSMPARDFDRPLNTDKDNIYEIGLLVKDSAGNRDSTEWKVIVKRIPPSAAQSIFKVVESSSNALDVINPQTLIVITKYANGDNYLIGGQLVVFSKISGSATIGEVTDHGNGTYSAKVYPGSTAENNVFVATLAGQEIMNGTTVPAKAVIDFVALDDTYLKDLKLSKGTLSPQFKSDIFDYSANVVNFTDEIFINPILSNQSAEIKINGVARAAGESQFKIPLKAGENIISILISSKNGLNKQTYTININRFASSLPYQESFENSTGDGLVFGGFPDQAKLTSGSIDEIGKGYLRLTNNKLNEKGFVYNSQKFSSEKGLSISFEYYSHAGVGGSGLSFFLFDASANFSIGAFGGSLGYAQNSTSAGLSKGFIGLGLDEFGEFSNPTSNRQGGPGRRPSSVVLRGDGDGKIGNLGTNYEYLSGLQTTDAAVMKVADAGNKFLVFGNGDGRTFDSALKGAVVEGYRKAKIVLVPIKNKPGFIINVWITEGSKTGGIIHHVIKNYSYIPTDGVPLDLKYGFAANTENTTNIYEVRNLEIDIPKLSDIPVLIPGNGDDQNGESVNSSMVPLATNLITPNGDGINDTWIIRNIDDFSNNTVRIFNRSGLEIYRKDNYKNDWDGRRDGSLLPAGTYYYIIETGNSMPPFKGYITIL